jgi:hypothetical protein
MYKKDNLNSNDMIDLIKIKRSSDDRKEFIESFYEFSLSDFEENFLKDFIDKCLLKKKSIEDAFELSIRLKYTTEVHFVLSNEMIGKRVSYFLKLTILDWLLVCFKNEDNNYFTAINEVAIKSSNPLVSFQATLNLVCVNDHYINYFLKKDSYVNAVFYYRFLSGINANEILKKKFMSYKDEIRRNVNSSQSVSENQKDELSNWLNECFSME